MEEVAAEGEILNRGCEGAQPFQGILQARRPVGVGDDPDLKAHLGRFPNRSHQYRVVQKGLSPLEVDPLDRAELFRLSKDVPNIPKRHSSALPGAAPGKTVIALEGALVRQEQVQSG
jgi:hypothetical protein